MVDNVAVTEGSGKNIASDDVGGVQYQRVKIGVGVDGSATDVSSVAPMPITLANSTGTIGVFLDSTAGTIAVQFKSGTMAVSLDPGHELGSIKGVNTTVAVYFDRGDPGVKITSGTVTSVTNTVAVYFDKGNPSVTAYGSQANVPLQTNSSGAIKVYDIADGSIVVRSITASISAHIASTGGTLIVKLDPATTVFNNNYSTVNIFTVAGSTSGVSPSGVTLVSPSANASFKVFAFSLQTTGIVSCVARFTNGGGSATEFWRGLVTANQTTSAPVGANLAVTPPAFLFATGASVTLSLHLDTATLVHYSVSYIKESA